MDTSSFFIKDKALFGSFPTQESISELENEGVRYFVDLTTPEEKETNKVILYTTKYNYINYPIPDRSVPTNLQSYAKFIIDISKIIKNLKNNEKLYISCRAGLGRSGVVVASILCYLFKLNPEQSLQYTTKCLNKRKILKEKWRKIGSPQTYGQKKFIYKFFFPLNYYKTYRYTNTFGFSNFSKHPVIIKNIGKFPTIEAAFQAHKNLNDKNYVDSLMKCNSGLMARYIGNSITPIDNWEENKLQIMEKLIKLKFDQNEDIREILLNTGLRPLIEHSKDDIFWSDNGDGTGQNNLGKILTKVRNNYYEKNIF